MRRLALGIACFIALVCPCVHAQVEIYDCYNGSAERGGNRITTNGIQSLQYVQQSYPTASVTVYVHNTTTLAPDLFQDGAGTVPLANPFSASANGVAFVCAPDGRYDFKYSGGGIPTPFTVSDIKFCFSCSGGGGGSTTVFKQVTNCTASGTVLNETVQESTQVVSGQTQLCATVGQPNSTTVVGVCNTGCGNAGVANIAITQTQSLILDNQGIAGDYIVPSTTIQGFGSDSGLSGGTRPAATVETLGIVSVPNVGGAGNAATVQLAPLSLVLPGSTGSGTVQNPNCAGSPMAFYPNGLIASITGDCFTSDDAAGHDTMKGLGLTDQGGLPLPDARHFPRTRTEQQLATDRSDQRHTVHGSGAQHSWGRWTDQGCYLNLNRCQRAPNTE
jgi:hypothetical protein